MVSLVDVKGELDYSGGKLEPENALVKNNFFIYVTIQLASPIILT